MSKNDSKEESRSPNREQVSNLREKKGSRRAHPKSASKASSPSDEAADSEGHFPIVAIGTSVGGLAALRHFFTQVPEKTGVAFVVIMHLSPEHESHLEELLQPYAKIPVQQVTQTITLEKDRVYLIPPNANLNSIDTHLRLTELESRREKRAPIDHFFRTLARTHDGQAIGVILTGTGSDGTLGLRQIKEKGGLTVVQDPTEAEYDGMPQSAIAAAPVDLILPLLEIPSAVLRFAQTRPQLKVPEEGGAVDADTAQLLQKVFAQIRARTGRDFSQYKRSTLLRRITRRMQFNQVNEPTAYLKLLRSKPAEVHELADDLLITVTSFFRDPEVFELLEKQVIPKLFDDKTSGDTLRVWSIGCATGEEAYSLAILLLEEAARRDVPPTIQIFASDLHHESLERARDGFYPGDIESDVRSDRLKHFFIKEKGGYRVCKQLRELVVFTPHNLLSDPPFSRIDLICCRNLLIYLRRDLQQQVAELLHYSLQTNGYLLLGTSEGIETGELFRIEDKKYCVYRKRNVPAPEPRLPVFPLVHTGIANETAKVIGGISKPPVAFGVLHQRLLEQYGPPSVLLSPNDNVVHFSAHAGRYLVHPGGEPTTNAFKLVRDELRVELRSILHAVRNQKRLIRTKPILVRFNGEAAPVVLDARLAVEPDQEGFVLLIFDERSGADIPSNSEDLADTAVPVETLRTVEEIQSEKELVEQRLQAIIEEYETSQEEIKASNEELQSANEELRSTLEELETSKEELQSMNEELQTVNQENRHKVEELGQLSNDLQNLLVATDIATIFLDRELRILRFTPKTAELFNVRNTDRGRPLSDLTTCIGYDALHSDAKKVLERLIPVEREVRDDSGRWYICRVLPYRTSDDRIAGVVVTLVEITPQKQAEENVRKAKEYSEQIIETLPEPLLVLSSDLVVKLANASFYNHFKVQADQTIGRRIYELGNGQWDIPELRALLEDILPSDNVFNGYEVSHVFEDLGQRVMMLNGRRLVHMQLILLGIHDITDRKQFECALEEANVRLLQADQQKNKFLAALSHELRNPLAAIRGGIDTINRTALKTNGNGRTLGIIDRQVTQLTVLVNDLLDITRITHNKVEIRVRSIDLREVVDHAIEDNRYLFEKNEVQLQLFPSPTPIPVNGDTIRLSQVIGNLLQNAVKFSQPGGVTQVTVTTEGQEAIVHLVDDGIGMSPETLSCLFEPFMQADQDTDRRRGGLGLGLFLSRKLIDLHAGRITAHSEGPGKGTEFRISLPLSNEPFAEPEIPKARAESEQRRILIIEDDADVAETLSAALERRGHAVVVARNGTEGIERARKFNPEVIFCDIGLPGMDGYDVARVIRKDNKRLKKALLIALSGYALPEDVKRALDAGFDHHLAKPPNLSDIREILAKKESS